MTRPNPSAWTLEKLLMCGDDTIRRNAMSILKRLQNCRHALTYTAPNKRDTRCAICKMTLPTPKEIQ